MEKKKVKKIKASNTLAQKVGLGDIDTTKIAAAQALIENAEVDFIEVAKPFLDQLQNAILAAKNPAAGATKESLANNITFPIMNLKANAATFKYPAVSEASAAVLDFLDLVKIVDNDIIVIADNLHKAITVIITQKLSGGDNPAGKAIVQEFKGVCKRYMDKRLSNKT